MAQMRDVFFNRIYERAKEDRDIVILSADFSAPSLDQYRLNLPQQYIFTGISEQNTILAAVGMALEGKKPICYAIAPFLTMRCYEQIRLYLAGMNLPITLVGVGAGVSYEDSGYTHYAVEDISIIRALPNFEIYHPCDNTTVELMADMVVESKNPVYIRLDRTGIDSIVENAGKITGGMREIEPVQETVILCTGNMVGIGVEAAKELKNDGINVGVVDACILPLEKATFNEKFRTIKTIITLEEHTLVGGFGSHVLELVSDLELPIKVKRLGLDLRKGYVHEYGGRSLVHEQYNMDVNAVIKAVKGE